jgi:hypothetical protein
VSNQGFAFSCGAAVVQRAWRRSSLLFETVTRLRAGTVSFAVSLAVIWNSPAAADVSTKPIGEQSCKELAKTEKRIKRDLAPNKSFKVQSKATQDAQKVSQLINRCYGRVEPITAA